MRIQPTDKILGATIEDIDLSKPLDDRRFAGVMKALGDHGVLCFPGQDLTPGQLRDFSARFGTLEINVGNLQKDSECPAIMTLSVPGLNLQVNFDGQLKLE